MYISPNKGKRPNRPDWLAEWSDYPHGSLEEKRARAIVWYAIELEERIRELEERLRVSTVKPAPFRTGCVITVTEVDGRKCRLVRGAPFRMGCVITVTEVDSEGAITGISLDAPD